MAPFACDANPSSSDAFGRVGQKARALARRDRMRNVGGMVCGGISSAPTAAGQEPQSFAGQHHPPGGRSQITLGDSAANPECVWPKREQSLPPSRQPRSDSGSYADALAAQMAEKRAMKAAEKRQRLLDDRVDDERVDREAGHLRQAVEGEIMKQRQREAVTAAREDALSQFLAQHGAGAGAAQAEGLEARRRAVPGLCGKPPSAPTPCRPVAGCPTSCPPARAHSTPAQRRPGPFATEEGPPSMQQPQHATPRENPLAPQRAEVAGAARVSSNVWASGANQNCGNFISDRPTSRVVQPPGGGSSLQLGW
mmetsp:Transcript_77493/g.250742  ORF Transcript_77493/g.250742 Transcript_77493/m.250742 type:complete len:310 (+) Transcript_77493:35-964(+)